MWSNDCKQIDCKYYPIYAIIWKSYNHTKKNKEMATYSYQTNYSPENSLISKQVATVLTYLIFLIYMNFIQLVIRV